MAGVVNLEFARVLGACLRETLFVPYKEVEVGEFLGDESDRCTLEES